MTVTVENTQVYAALPSMALLVQEFFNFPTAAEFERIMSCVEVEFPCVISTSQSPSPSSAASLLES